MSPRLGRLGTALRSASVAVAASSMFGQLAVAVTGPVLVRMLGVDRRGQLALAYVAVLFFAQVGMFGVPTAFTYFSAKRGVNARALLRRCWPAFAAMSGVAAVAAAAWTYTQYRHRIQDGGTVVLVVGTGVVIVMWWFLLSAALLGEHKFQRFALARALTSGIYLAFVIALAVGVSSPSVQLCLEANLGSSVIGLVITFRMLPTRRPPGRDDAAQLPSLREIASFGARTAVDAAAPVDGLSIDQILIGLTLGTRDLGLYVIGYAFESLPVLVLTALAQVALPKLSAISGTARVAAARRAWLIRAVLAGVAAVVLAEAVVRPVVVLAFGAQSEGAIPIARVLIPAGLFLGGRKLGSAMLQAEGRPGAATVAEIVGLVVLCGSLVPAAMAFGGVGAAWALLGSAALCVGLQAAQLARTPRHQAPVPTLDVPALTLDVPVLPSEVTAVPTEAAAVPTDAPRGSKVAAPERPAAVVGRHRHPSPEDR